MLVVTACTSVPFFDWASPVAGSPSPSPSPGPSFASGQTVFVQNTDGYGAEFRRAPGSAGDRIGVLPEGVVLTATGQQQQTGERTWAQVRDSTGIVGWVIADFLSGSPPPRATPTLVPALAAPQSTPSTLPPPNMPTPPEPTSLPRPADTLVPIAAPRTGAPGLAPIPPMPTARPPEPTLPPLAPEPTPEPAVAEPTRTVRPTSTLAPARPTSTLVIPTLIPARR